LRTNVLDLVYRRDPPVGYGQQLPVCEDWCNAPSGRLNEHIRTILCGWLAEVVRCLKWQTATLTLTIALLDRTVLVVPVTRSNLQLHGCACAVIASNLLEQWPVSLSEYVRLSCNSFDQARLKECVARCADALKYDFYASGRANDCVDQVEQNRQKE
jgi:hypothetical protein